MQKIVIINESTKKLSDLSQILLQKLGVEPHCFEDPVRAVQWLKEHPVELAIVDHKITKLSGISTVAAIRALPGFARVPVLYMLPIEEGGALEEAFEVGVTDFILSPFEETRLLARVRNLLEMYRSYQDLEVKSHASQSDVPLDQEMIRAREERYRIAVNGSKVGVWDWNLQTNRLFYSRQWCKNLGYAKSEVPAALAFWTNRVHPNDLDHLTSEIDKHLTHRVPHLDVEYRILHRSGNYIWVRTRGTAVFDPSGHAIRLLGTQHDITERKENQAQLLYEAFHDPLTGLPNRTLFDERLRQELLRFKRDPRERFAVMFIDLDHLKEINDTYGHSGGDQLLREVTRILTECTREVDTVARLAGDEFLILLERVGSPENVKIYLDRLYEASKTPVMISDEKVPLEFSIGITVADDSHETHDTLVKEADAALYQAKEQGRNQAVFFSKEFTAKSPRRREIMSSLSDAITKQEIKIYYQPIVNLKTQEVQGYEALVRWHHPRLGIISPDDFISLAEKNNSIIDLGDLVLDGALAQLSIWQKRRQNPDLFICVNVAATQVKRTNFLGRLDVLCETHDVKPDRIILEFSESSLEGVKEWSYSALHDIRAAGYHLALDDYGEMRASLRSLVEHPIDYLKIDRSLSLEMHADERKRKIYDLMLLVGKANDFQIIVEGIQDQDILDRVLETNADMGQGFFFSKAKLPEELDSNSDEKVI